jgi:hypothetical protein
MASSLVYCFNSETSFLDHGCGDSISYSVAVRFMTSAIFIKSTET